MKPHPLVKYQELNKKLNREKVIIGKEVFVTSDNTKIQYWEGLPHTNEKSNLIIGNYVSIAPECNFLMGGNHRLDWITTHLLIGQSEIKNDEIISNGDIIIGNDVLIGYQATILSGTIIPDGCVIGANSVVSGNKFEPYDIIVGNPAKTIKKRFDDETINLLLDIKWWDWDDEKIKKYSDILKSNDIEKLKEIYEKSF